MILFKLIIKFWLKKNKKLRIKIFEILKYLYHKICNFNEKYRALNRMKTYGLAINEARKIWY